MSKITDAWEQLGIIQRQRFEQATGATPLRLTDAEREALEVAIRCVDSVRSWKAPQDALREKMIEHAATLRGLLDRLGHQ